MLQMRLFNVLNIPISRKLGQNNFALLHTLHPDKKRGKWIFLHFSLLGVREVDGTHIFFSSSWKNRLILIWGEDFCKIQQSLDCRDVADISHCNSVIPGILTEETHVIMKFCLRYSRYRVHESRRQIPSFTKLKKRPTYHGEIKMQCCGTGGAEIIF